MEKSQKAVEDLADFVRRIRFEKDISQRDVETRSHGTISKGYIGQIENRAVLGDSVTPKMLRALAQGLQVSEDEIFAVVRGKSVAEPSIEHARLIEMYEDIPRQCQQDVLDLLGVLQRNHSISARKGQRAGRRIAAVASASALTEAQMMDRPKELRPVEVEPEEGEEVPQANSPEMDEDWQEEHEHEEVQPKRRANGN